MKIEDLLEKYFSGETTAEEERMLREYFRRPDLPEQLSSYRPLFAYFDEEIDRSATPPEKREVARNVDAAKRRVVKSWRPWFRRIVNIAAVFLTFWVCYEMVSSRAEDSENYVVINGRYSQDARLVEVKALEALDNVAFDDEDMEAWMELDI